MNALVSIIQSVSEGKSGHWGLVASVAVGGLDATAVEKLAGGRNIAFLHLETTSHFDLVDKITGEICKVTALDGRLRRLLEEAKTDDRAVARCLITRFGELSLEDQCLVLRQSRAVRESENDAKLQTILCGAWNLFRVQEYWRTNLSSLSPVPDRKHVFFECSLGCNAVLEKLREAGCVSHPASRFEEVCAEALSEVTGGDSFLLDYVIGAIRVQRQRLEDFETIIGHVAEAGEVTDEIRKRADRLTPGAWAILDAVVRQQFITRPERDTDAEDLRLGGFVSARPIGQNKCLSVASPLIEQVIRHQWSYYRQGLGEIYKGVDLARPVLALNTAAYRIVAQIENTLRNLVVLALNHPEVGDWTKRLDGVKTLAYDGGEIPNELLGLARQIRELLLPFTESQCQEPANVESVSIPDATTASRKPKQSSLVETALSWRARQQANIALSLSHESLIYFFTTEGLMSVLVNEKQEIYPKAVKPYFPNKHELTNLLEQYVAIRAAVAHNQPISLATLKRLETLRDDLEKRICQAQIERVESWSNGGHNK